jgi:hypothetical protein
MAKTEGRHMPPVADRRPSRTGRLAVIDGTENRLIRKKAGQHRARNRRQGQQEGRREVFRGKARGREGRVCHGVLVR